MKFPFIIKLSCFQPVSKAALGLFLLGCLLPVRAQAEAVDPLLPADTQILVSVNVRQIVDSELFKKHAQPTVRALLANLEEATKILKNLGLDPLRDIDRVVLASPGGKEEDRGLAILRGRFDLTKIKPTTEQIMKDHPTMLRKHSVKVGEQRIPVYEVRVPDPKLPLWLAVPNKTTALVALGKDYVVDALKKVGDKKTVLKNKDFQALLAGMDLNKSVVMAAVGKALTDKGIREGIVRSTLQKVQAVGGGLSLTQTDVQLEVVVSAHTILQGLQLKTTAEKGLKQVVTLLALAAVSQPEFTPAFEIVRVIRVSRKGKVVTFKGKLDTDVIAEMFKPDE